MGAICVSLSTGYIITVLISQIFNIDIYKGVSHKARSKKNHTAGGGDAFILDTTFELLTNSTLADQSVEVPGGWAAKFAGAIQFGVSPAASDPQRPRHLSWKRFHRRLYYCQI
jgi:hypothetical protein